MILKSIEILNFKNIASASLEFSPGVNCLLGMNGMGKSNLLDAIHLLSMARPMASTADGNLVRHGEDLMLVKGIFHTDIDTTDTISCGLAKGKRKSLKRNGKEYGKFSDHIGKYPIVISTPDDARIVAGSAEERRKIIDMVISQADPQYLAALIKYSRALENRNKMLRAGIQDKILYESIETILAESAAIIFNARKEWIVHISPLVSEIYNRISGGRETVRLSYKSQLDGTDMKTLLDARRQKDQILGFTSAGVHRDDMELSMDSYSIRTIGSQGQLKTMAVSLRLAIFKYLGGLTKMTPLLLLDDIFDKLDAERVGNIMKEVTAGDNFGQIFITDTNRQHLDSILAAIKGECSLINVDKGIFSPLEF